MWISEFTCGVVATVLIEMVCFIAYGFYLTRKEDEDETDNTNQESE